MLAKRILSGVIIAIIGLALVFAGGWVYTIGISLILARASWEYINMFASGKFNPDFIPTLLGTVLIILLSSLENNTYSSLAIILTIFTILFSKMINYQKVKETAAMDVAIELSTITFIILPGSYLIRLRFLTNGLYWVLISILPICISDIAAYAIGSLLGKHKLAPNISPKKTVEGFVSGVIAAILSGLATGAVFRSTDPSIDIFASIFISLVAGLISPFGDLSKSIIKRHFSLKNTGNLIPGHGGILDRIDTWLWAAPISYFLAIYFFI